MNPLIVTAIEGDEFAAVREITWPRLAAYASKHGMGFIANDMTGGIKRPSSWKKLSAIAGGLAYAETVIWVDADVFVLNFADDIMAGVPDVAWQAMVRHHTNEGDVPNAGVWIVRRPMLPYLMAAAMRDECINHPWWEQAAIHNMMGFVFRDGRNVHVSETTLYRQTHWLDESFNICRYSPPGTKQNWLHACGLVTNRLEAIQEWDRAANA